jgi:hypothetical protein
MVSLTAVNVALPMLDTVKLFGFPVKLLDSPLDTDFLLG